MVVDVFTTPLSGPCDGTTMIHHLTDRDVKRRSASCSVCGPVKIQKSGTGWVCGLRANAHARVSKRRRPDRRRTGDNPHRLTDRVEGRRRATCSVCGPRSAIVPWGGGWICRARSRELGRVTVQAAPTRHCRDCVAADGTFVWLDAAGDCPRCALVELNAMLAADAADERLRTDDDWFGEGLHLVGLADPYEMPELENAVPGWKTLPTG